MMTLGNTRENGVRRSVCLVAIPKNMSALPPKADIQEDILRKQKDRLAAVSPTFKLVF